jgi:hypothetical protein
MAYIIKNTSGLLNTRFTDAGREKLSQGRLNIKYFQIGDSEVSYSVIPNYDQTNTNILEAAHNAQNITQQPQTNKMHVKYPYYVKGSSGNTYGLAVQESDISSVFNKAATRGFFTGTQYNWSAQTSSAYTKTCDYILNTCNYCTSNSAYISASTCSNLTGTPAIGDIAVIYFDNAGGCGTIPSDFPVLTYRVQDIVSGNILVFDRDLPNFSGMSFGFTNCCADARIFIYPSGMTELYDTSTPLGYINPNVINYETFCDLDNPDVKIWNMNIPWSVSPAGLNYLLNEDYKQFGSTGYLGSKEYFGYQGTSGQTFLIETYSAETISSSDTFYYNSYDEIIKVQPYEQKAIAILHYTNNSYDNFYGEKFALEPYDANAIDTTGFARNFKVTLPTLMWHKSDTGAMGETFYVDPTVGTSDYFKVKYMYSLKNGDMNDPGLRYYHLWDTYTNSDGNPSRVGKVFPDLKTIIFDDDEIVAALSYKSNRNWTLSAPKLSLMVPNACDTVDDDYGLMGDDKEYLYVTYRFNSTAFTDSLHCNYYTKIQGAPECVTTQRQDVAVKFGPEFPFLKECCFQGYSANEFYILAQKVTGSTTQPDPSSWKIIDYTSQLTGSSSNGYITQAGLTANTYTIRYNQYMTASTYNLGNYINLPTPSGQTELLTFGDEYFFYGNVDTDIQATIYEMKFLCNLGQTQFTYTSNPTWTPNSKSYITEVGLFDDQKDLLVITKFQSPVLRQGTQQIAVKLDF